MCTIYVKDKILYTTNGNPVEGTKNLFIQGEIGNPYDFIFNTNAEHEALKTLTFKVTYIRKDKKSMTDVLGKPTINADGTFTVTWTPDAYVTCFNGQMTFCFGAYDSSDTLVWKTVDTSIIMAQAVSPEVIDPDEKHVTYDALMTEVEEWVGDQKGIANGLASLDENGKVPSSQIDLEMLDNFEIGYYYDGKFYKDAEHTTELEAREEALYIDKTTNPASLYVYNGTAYEKVSDESNVYTKAQIDTLLLAKVTVEEGKGLSEEDFTTLLKAKLTSLPTKETYDSDLEALATSISSLGELLEKKYTKPTSGIPKTDLAQSVQASLDKADSAIQEHQSLEAYRTSEDQDKIDEKKVSKVEGSSLVPDTKIASYDEHIADSDIHVTTDDKTAWNAKYDKPEAGIPKADLAPDVQTSLDKADSALQKDSLANYSLITDTGYKLDLEIDSETYVITPKMYDKNGTLISTGKTVDLPLESVVVSGSYDTTNKKIVLTLKNGSTVDVPLGDLITGLATQEWVEEKGYYTKPSTGIPSTDMSEAVQTSLGLADSALQEHQSLADYRKSADQDVIDAKKYEKPSTGIPKTDLAEGVQSSLDKADSALQEHQSLEAYRTSKEQDDLLIKEFTEGETDNSHYPSAKLVKDEVDEINSKLGVSLTLTSGGLLHLEEI